MAEAVVEGRVKMGGEDDDTTVDSSGGAVVLAVPSVTSEGRVIVEMPNAPTMDDSAAMPAMAVAAPSSTDIDDL
jgi:hypothetical protein